MTRFARLSLLLLILPVLVQAGKQANPGDIKDPRTMVFPTMIDFETPQVEKHSLSNGIEVYLIEDHELPLVDVIFYIDAGENRVQPKQAGLAMLTADLIVEGGSKSVDNKTFQDSLARVGATFVAKGGSDRVYYNLHTLSSHVDNLLPMIAGAMKSPAFPQSQLVVNKYQYLTSYKGRNSEPRGAANRIYSKLIYGEGSYKAREFTPASLENIDITSLNDFHRANYRPSHVIIGVVGDFDSQQMLELLEASFGDWKESAEPAWEMYPAYQASAEPGVYYVHWPGSVQSTVMIGHQGLIRNDSQYPASRLLVEIYSGSRFARLRREIRVDRGYAYVTGGYISSSFTEPGIYGAYALTKSKSSLDALGILIDVTTDIKENGISKEELEKAKQSWLASFPSFYSDPENVIYDRMVYASHGYPIDFWEKLPERIEPLMKDDVDRFASEFFDPSQFIIFILGDSTDFEGSISDFGNVTVINPEEY